MFHYFAKLGAKPWAKAVTPSVGLFAGYSYIACHTVAQGQIIKFFEAEDTNGEPITISEKLTELITQVSNDVKDKLVKPFNENFDNHATRVRWFCSSTPDLITIGTRKGAQGIAIGIPPTYNYSSIDELPVTEELKRFKLFKTAKDIGEDKNELDEGIPGIERTELVNLSEEYRSSLLLSDQAKKFSLAHGIFYADSTRVLSVGSNLCATVVVPVIFARIMVKLLKQKSLHLLFRIPTYFFSAALGVLNYYALDEIIETYYTEKADQRAVDLGEAYKEGAIELLTKSIQRNKALQSILKDSFIFDKDGNRLPSRLSYSVPLTERLALVKGEKVEKKIGILGF